MSGEDREPVLVQRISVVIQRFKRGAFARRFFCRPTTRISACYMLQTLIFFVNFFIPLEYTYRGLK